MFEILKAILGLQQVADETDRHMVWNIADEPGGETVLTVRVTLHEGDAQFVEDMRAMFAPID